MVESAHKFLVKCFPWLLGSGAVISAAQSVNQPLIIEKVISALGVSGIAGSDAKTSLLLGISMAISVVHQPDQPLLWAVFLPQLGSILLLLIPFMYLRKDRIDLGDKWVWMPLAGLVLIACIRPLYVLITGDTVWGMNKEITHALYLVGMFLLYLTSRKMGLQIFRIMPLFVVIASLGMVGFGFANPGLRTGGLISFSNYDMATLFLIFGMLVSPKQHRWWLSAFVVVGLFFTGAEIALFVMGVLFLVVLIRRDWGVRMLAPTMALAVTLLVCTPLGITQKLYTPAYSKVMALAGVPFADNMVASVPVYDVAGYGIVVDNITQKEALLQKATNLRWSDFWVLSPIKPLGYGYNVNYFYYPLDEERGTMTEAFKKSGVVGGIPHNQILIIIEQLGLGALVLWLIATGRLLWKSGWTYAWIGFLAIGVFDHENWTSAAPYFWLLAGVCSANPITGKDYIFRATK